MHYQRWAEKAGCIMKQNPHDFLDDIDTVVVPIHVGNTHYVRPPRLLVSTVSSLHFTTVQLDFQPSQHAICGY